MRSTWWIVVLSLAHAACLRSTEYRCATSAECGTAGTCEAVGYCSVIDSSCDSGGRFTDAAGSYANQCVGAGSPDAGIVDGTLPIDAPSAGCPSGYATLTGGQPTHQYRRIPAANWNAHKAFCTSTIPAAYLAVPDDLAELQALVTLAAAARLWVGVTDAATEGTWLTVKGAPQTFLPWGPGEPDGGGSDDCVEVHRDDSKIYDERCNAQNVAVCECER